MEKSQESTYTNTLANWLHKPYTRDRILSSPYKDYEYNPTLIIELLDCLRIENCVVSVASQLLSGFDKKERWFNVEYKYEPINEKLVKVSKAFKSDYNKYF